MSMSLPNTTATQDTLPHDIRGLVPYNLFWDTYGTKILLALGILCLCLVLYYLWKKFHKKKVKEILVEDPFLVLEKRLLSMKAPEPFEGKKAVQYFFDLNMIFREFIELCSGIPATDLTLQELKEPFRFKSPLSRDVTEDVLRFLERCEGIKFAGKESDLKEAEQSHKQVQVWVSYLRPRHLTDKETSHR